MIQPDAQPVIRENSWQGLREDAYPGGTTDRAADGERYVAGDGKSDTSPLSGMAIDGARRSSVGGRRDVPAVLAAVARSASARRSSREDDGPAARPGGRESGSPGLRSRLS